MKIGRLNHVGVAVPDIEAAKKTYADLYGATDATVGHARTKESSRSVPTLCALPVWADDPFWRLLMADSSCVSVLSSISSP